MIAARFLLLTALLAWTASALARSPGDLAIYSLGADDAPSSTFRLQANSSEVPVLAHTALYDYAHFSAEGAVAITITIPEPVRAWQISPRSLGVAATKSGHDLKFTLPAGTYAIIQINDLKALALAIDTLEHDAPKRTDPRVYDVTAAPYQADSSGNTLVTDPLQRAINDAHRAGGGIVYLPAGTFLSGSLQLKSNVSLYLDGSAVLRSSGDPAHFKAYYRKNSLSMDGSWFLHTEPGSENIRIFGRGTIDGNARELRGKNHYLNNLVVPLQTSRFTIEGVVLRDSGLWGLIPTRSDHVTIRDTKHFNEADLFFEDDAIDIIESQDVLVSHTLAISEDDTYSTKTWNKETDIAAHWPGEPEALENVIFEHCLAWSRCAAFKVGFGCFQPQRAIVFRDSTAFRSMRALAVNRRWGNANAEHITFENIAVEGFQPRQRDADKCRWLELTNGPGAPVVDIELQNITVLDIGPNPSVIEGTSEAASISGLRIENVVVKGQVVTTMDDLNVRPVGAHVDAVTFR